MRTEVLEAEPMRASVRLKDEVQPAGDPSSSQAFLLSLYMAVYFDIGSSTANTLCYIQSGMDSYGSIRSRDDVQLRARLKLFLEDLNFLHSVLDLLINPPYGGGNFI